jgi:hypothetical protein
VPIPDCLNRGVHPRLLCLSVRQVKRLKKRMREDGEAALAHANRGRPSSRRLPDAMRQRIVQLSRGTYAGFNDYHLCEKLVEREGFSLSREPCAACCARTVSARPESAELPLIASAACGPLGSVNWCNSTAARTTGSKAAARSSPLSACRTMPPAKSWPLSSSPRKPLSAISACFANGCAALAYRWVQWDGRRFQIPQQARRYSFAGAKVRIYQALDGRVSLYYGDTRLEHSPTGGDIFMLLLG